MIDHTDEMSTTTYVSIVLYYSLFTLAVPVTLGLPRDPCPRVSDSQQTASIQRTHFHPRWSSNPNLSRVSMSVVTCNAHDAQVCINDRCAHLSRVFAHQLEARDM